MPYRNLGEPDPVGGFTLLETQSQYKSPQAGIFNHEND